VLSRSGPEPSRHPPPSQRPVLFLRYHIPSAEVTVTRLHRGFTAVRPSGLLLACSPRMEQEPLGLHPDASHPAVTHNARQGRRQALSTGLELHLRHCRTSIGVLTHNVRPRVAPATPPHRHPLAGNAPIPRQGKGLSMVPTFTVVRSTGEAPGFAPAVSSWLRRRQFTTTCRARHIIRLDSSPRRAAAWLTAPGTVTHRTPAPIHRVRAGRRSRGFTTPVPHVHLPVSLTRPGPSGSAGPP
jgi:hypothetical protein